MLALIQECVRAAQPGPPADNPIREILTFIPPVCVGPHLSPVPQHGEVSRGTTLPLWQLLVVHSYMVDQ